MKDIQQLLLKIDYFLVLAEEDADSFMKTAREQLSREHALNKPRVALLILKVNLIDV